MSNGTVATNSNIPQIPQPVANVGALANAVQALKQGVDSLAGNRGSTLNRAVTFNDLINLGVVSSSLLTTATTITSSGIGLTGLGTIGPHLLIGNPGTGSAVPVGIAIGSGLSLSTGGTLNLGTIAADELLGNSGTVGAVPTGIAIGANLTLTGGTLSASSGGEWSGGTVTGVSTSFTIVSDVLGLAPIGASLVMANMTALSDAPSGYSIGQILASEITNGNSQIPFNYDNLTFAWGALNIGTGLTVSGTAPNFTLAASVGTVATGFGVGLNSGTLSINSQVTLTGTAGGTLTIAPGTGTSDVLVNMPASGGTVTLAIAPTFPRQRIELDIKQGATPGAVVLNSGFVFSASGGPGSYTATPTASAIDSLMLISPDGTHARVTAIDQGFTV